MLSFNLYTPQHCSLPLLPHTTNRSAWQPICVKKLSNAENFRRTLATITTIRQNQLRAADNCVSRKSWHIRCLKQSNKYGDKENTAETARSTQVEPHYTPGLIYLALLRRQKWTFTSPNTNLGALQSICYLCINNW